MICCLLNISNRENVVCCVFLTGLQNEEDGSIIFPITGC